MLDEADALSGLLADISAQRGVCAECVVADGGSTDAGLDVARAHGARWITAERGRGAQMNAGAQDARGDWLCFLHADSRLTHPDQLHDAVQTLAAESDLTAVAGHFALCFIRRAGSRPRLLYRYMEAKTATGRRYTINGDQGVLIHRRLFTCLGGFDTRQRFLEDQRMAAAVAAHGRWVLLPHRLASSARRFETEGEGARYTLMALIMAMYIADVDVFFRRAPRVYPQQSATGRLCLMPYFRLLRALVREHGVGASAGVGWRIAGILLSQTWQLFFLLDVALGYPRVPLARSYTRYAARLIEQPLSQALLFVVLWALVFGPLQLWCWLSERTRLR